MLATGVETGSTAALAVAGVLMFTVGALATARLTRLLIEDEIADPLRRAVLSRLDPDNAFHLKLVYLMGCRWCVSIWTGAPVAAALIQFPGSALVWIALSTLAFSQITGILGTISDRNDSARNNQS